MSVQEFVEYLEPIFIVTIDEKTKPTGKASTSSNKIHAICRKCKSEFGPSTAKNVICKAKKGDCPVGDKLKKENMPFELFKKGIPMEDVLNAQEEPTVKQSPKSNHVTTISQEDEDIAQQAINNLETTAADTEPPQYIKIDKDFYKRLRSLKQTGTTKDSFLLDFISAYKLDAEEVFMGNAEDKAARKDYIVYKTKFESHYETPKREHTNDDNEIVAKPITNKYKVQRYRKDKNATEEDQPHVLEVSCRGKNSTKKVHEFNIKPETIPMLADNKADGCIFCTGVIPEENIEKYQDDKSLSATTLTNALQKFERTMANKIEGYSHEILDTVIPPLIGVTDQTRDLEAQTAENKTLAKLDKYNFDDPYKFAEDIKRIRDLENAMKRKSSDAKTPAVFNRYVNKFKSDYGFDPLTHDYPDMLRSDKK